MSDYTLYNNDCLSVMKEFSDKSIDCVITDLPYYKVVKEEWDNLWKSEKDYLVWVESIICEYSRILKDNASLLIFTGRQYNRKICNILDNFFDERRIIIWNRKRAFNNTRGKALASSYEPICYYTKGNPTFNNLKIKSTSTRKEYTDGYLKDGISLSDVWSDIPALPHNSKERVKHPTQKPLTLMERCVSLVSNEGDIILDNCMGSGSTGVACMKLNRNFIGIEKELDYFNIAKERIDVENLRRNLSQLQICNQRRKVYSHKGQRCHLLYL